MTSAGPVLFIAPLPPPVTGQALACRTLLTGLERQGPVEVIDTMKGHYRQGFTSLLHCFRVLGFAWRIRRRARRAAAVYINPSQTVAGNLKDLLLFLALGRSLERTVLHLHGGGLRNTVYDRFPLLRWLNRRALSRMRAAVVLGESLRPVFAGMLPPERIKVVRNYAPDELFLPPGEVAAKMEQRDGPIRVLFMTNFFRSKGLFDLLAAAEEAHRQGLEELHFQFAGGRVEERDQQEFENRIAALPRAEHLGFLQGEERRRILARAQVLALPTYYPYEGQPLCILEAYASGCAVVATDQGGIPDIFQDRVNGARVPPRDPRAILAALRGWVDDRQALAAIGRANREAAEHYRTDRFLAEMTALLRP